MMNQTFYMLRHGETVANAEGYVAGSGIDTPLTSAGRAQAKAARSIIHHLSLRPDFIVHSGLVRARDTALIINDGLNLPMFEQVGLNEQNFGAWQGQSWGSIKALFDAKTDPPDGESFKDFYARSIAASLSCFALYPGVPLIVSHGGVFDAWFDYLNQPVFDVSNCGLYRFDPMPVGWVPVPCGV